MTITEQLAAALRGILNNCQTVRPSEDNIVFSFSDPVNPSYIVSARRVDSARTALAAFDTQPAADDGAVERVARIIHTATMDGRVWGELTDGALEHYHIAAHAALAAMAAPAADTKGSGQ